jgi:hypothetical protein
MQRMTTCPAPSSVQEMAAVLEHGSPDERVAWMQAHVGIAAHEAGIG